MITLENATVENPEYRQFLASLRAGARVLIWSRDGGPLGYCFMERQVKRLKGNKIQFERPLGISNGGVFVESFCRIKGYDITTRHYSGPIPRLMPFDCPEGVAYPAKLALATRLDKIRERCRNLAEVTEEKLLKIGEILGV